MGILITYILLNKYMLSKVKKKKEIEVGTTPAKVKDMLSRM